MKKLFKYLMIAFAAIKLIATVLFFDNSPLNNLFSALCAFGVPYGLGMCFSELAAERLIGALTVIFEIHLLPVFILIGAFCKKGKVRRGSAIVLGALSLVDGICCVVSMLDSLSSGKTVNLIFSLIHVVICIIVAVQSVKKQS